MADILRLEDANAEEITRLLQARGRHLAEDQADEARRTACQIRQLKQAFDTLQSLRGLDKVA